MRPRDATMLGDQLSAIDHQKIVELTRRIEGQPALRKTIHQGIVVALRRPVGIAPTRMPAQVAIKVRADVPQFVNHRRKFFFERRVHKTRQVKTENVEVLAARCVEYRINTITPPTALRGGRSPFKSQRGQ